jgi:uncharacterized membrane protein
VPVSLDPHNPIVPSNQLRASPIGKKARPGFAEDFKRFFLSGLKALLPTLITLSLILWVWDWLWEHIGQYLILAIKDSWSWLADRNKFFQPNDYIGYYWSDERIQTHIVGVLLAVLAVYIVGLLVGNLIGRTFWKLGEGLVLKIPIVRAIYPAVKQVTDFVLADRQEHFQANHVVAVQPHSSGIWSIGLVTGGGLRPVAEHMGEEMVTVFVPSSPTAFTGYVLVVPRSGLVELPMTVEEAMRLLVSGGVIEPRNKADGRMQKAE